MFKSTGKLQHYIGTQELSLHPIASAQKFGISLPYLTASALHLMPAPVAPNPDLALWIAGIGFLSSLAVVLINAMVTVASKRIDAQLKKDEQSYGYSMEYLKRKLSAGEKAVAHLTLWINTLTVLKDYYQLFLEPSSTNETLEGKKNHYDKIYAKYFESSNNENNYLAYFSNDENEKDLKAEELDTEKNEIMNKIELTGIQLAATSKLLKTEIIQSKKEELLKNKTSLTIQRNNQIKEYITSLSNNIAEIKGRRKRIRLQMESASK